MRRLGTASLWVAAAAVIGLSIAGAYFQTFELFAPYDDEGYMMLSVRHLLAGHRLYDEIQVFYGPFYYLEKWLIHGVMGVPLTHCAVRATTLATRMATATVAAVTAVGIAGSPATGALAFFAVDTQLWRLAAEPGHPQELGVLLTMGLPLVASFVGRHRGRTVAALGILTASLLMVKLNVGAFGTLAVWLAVLASMPPSRVVRILHAGSLLVAIGLPWIVVQMHPDWTAFAGLVCMWVIALASVDLFGAGGSLRVVHAFVFLLATMGTVVTLAVFGLTQGASVGAMLDMLVVRVRLVATDFLFPMPVVPWDRWTAVAGVVGSLAWVVIATRWARAGRGAWAIGALLTSLVAGRALFIVHNLAGFVMPLAIAPFAWVVLLPGPAEPRPWTNQFARRVVAWLAVLQPLQAFPVPGSQVACGALPAVLCGMIAVGDAAVTCERLIRAPLRRYLRPMAACLVLAVALRGSWWTFELTRTAYEAGETLDLPGTGPLRIDHGRAVIFREMVTAVRQRCAVLLTVPGFHSLNFWTQVWPPTVDLVGQDTRFLGDDRIAALVTMLAQFPTSCVLQRPSLSPKPPDPRIEAQIMRFFVRERSWGPYVLFVHVRRGLTRGLR